MIKICNIYSVTFFILSLVSFIGGLFFLVNNLIVLVEYETVIFNTISIEMVILLDSLSLLFLSLVLVISSMVIYYCNDYMHGDLNLVRFILLVVMFVISMILLIISPNLISILLGWDGLGLVSYILVIYYQNIKSFNAGMLTALSNRIGDVALLVSIAWLLNYGSWTYIFYLDFMKNDYIMQLVSLLIILAAFTKSAQIPFSSWLPAAMAAPTPVSSLVHSSTLVTAGVYLLIRFSESFSLNLMYLMLIFSCLTMFMSGLGANYEFDLKKIIALSTLSQLGLMMSILFLGDSKLAFYHLLVHALFKALLFMCAGNIIHNMMNCQDIRYMGDLIKFLPLTCSYLMICNFALCGLPFMSGFYSKDLIVEFMSMEYLNMFIYFIFYVSIGLTVSYSMRLSYYVLFGEFNFNNLNLINEKEYDMLMGMTGLIFFVIFSGSMLSWLMFYIPYVVILPLLMKIMTLIMIFMGGWLGYEISKFKVFTQNLNWTNNLLMKFLGMMWNLPYLSTLSVNFYPNELGMIYSKIFDQGWSEYYGSKKLSMIFIYNSQFFQVFFKNHLKIYLLMMSIWIILLLYL
uniref:NADH-ubiquinone oxidoreductase chain 5 n=1 Tax=Brentidae sp. GENSP01 TaxID=1205806 RepID=A0A0S2MQQ6_9CUCU|nr:NADH deshydrogenase subunit 5 [Brentidae sp. GENSP01]